MTGVPQRQQTRFDALDLLARQRHLVLRAPVDRGHRAVGQAALEEPQEEPLVPLVVLGLAGDDLGVPVERRAHRAQLAAHVLDVAHRPDARVDVARDRGVLGRQPERVEADREEDVVAVHPPEARDRVGRRLDVPVPDVQVARRVRVHREQVELAPARVVEVGVVRARLVPARLPARLDLGRVVALDARAAGGAVGGVRWVVGRSSRNLPQKYANPSPLPARGDCGSLLSRSARGRTEKEEGGRDGVAAATVGGATGARTPDLLNAIQTLSQLSYSPTESRGSRERGV